MHSNVRSWCSRSSSVFRNSTSKFEFHGMFFFLISQHSRHIVNMLTSLVQLFFTAGREKQKETDERK